MIKKRKILLYTHKVKVYGNAKLVIEKLKDRVL